MNIRILAAAAPLLLCAACNVPGGKPTDPNATFYTVTTEIDPITDAKTTTAKALANSDNGLNTGSITWTCKQPDASTNGGDMELAFTSFKPAKLNGELEAADIDSVDRGGVSAPVKEVRFRIGKSKGFSTSCPTIDLRAMGNFYADKVCDYSNQLTVDLQRNDIGLTVGDDGRFVATPDESIAWQYVVNGVTYNYTAPINQQVADVLNMCVSPPQPQDAPDTSEDAAPQNADTDDESAEASSA